jgi:hypothetical protein
MDGRVARAAGAVVRQLAQDFGATFVPFQEMFDGGDEDASGCGARRRQHPSELGHKRDARGLAQATGL